MRQRRNSSDYYTRNYIDNEGYRVSEIHTPTSHLVMRCNASHCIIMQNTKVLYDGPYDEWKWKQQVASFDRQMDIFDEQLELLDKHLENLDEQLDYIDSQIALPTYHSDSYHRPNSSNSINYTTNATSNDGCCLGCIIYVILSIIFIALIIAGLGYLGNAIIHWIASLF